MATPSSTDSLLNKSPISRVPYDVLREIFIHCLPQYRLRILQPNTVVAPMLLCQICSSWRTAALNSRILWSHLLYRLTIAEDDNQEWKVLKNGFAFLSWWRRNQGTTAPYLAIYISQKTDDISRYRELKLDSVEIASLFKYIASAQYLEIENFSWFMLDNWNCNDGYPKIYPTPHTLVKSGYDDSDFFYPAQALVANHTPSTLRRLCITDSILPNDFVIPTHWSKLTRIALDDVEIPLDAWFSFIRAVPDLQWGNSKIIPLNGEHIQPSKYTHLQLSTVSVIFYDMISSSSEFPFSTLFTNLYLPALYTLSVSYHGKNWYSQRLITELPIMLDSTPALKTLILEDSFFSMDREFPAIQNTQPFWHHTPHLVHLKLQWNHPEFVDEKTRYTIIRNVLRFDNHWLGLHNSTCPIQKITLVDSFIPSDPESETINDVTMSKFRNTSR